MSRTTLEDRIEAWPEHWREARTRYVEAKALVARLELQLERAQERASARGLEEGEIGLDEGSASASQALIAADQHLLDLDFQIQRATFAIERARAEADVRTRTAAQAATQKLTEAAVDARVKSDAAYIASQEHLLELKHQQALAKLDRDQQWRQEREQRRMAAFTEAAVDEEPETEETRALREQLDDAYRQLEKARTDLSYQKRVGRALQMLTEVLKADSVVAATIPARAR